MPRKTNNATTSNGGNPVPTKPSGPRKRKFLRRATILHACSLFVMLVVFIYLSIHLANRTLEELVPSGGKAIAVQNGTETAEQRQLSADQALQIAKIFDSAPREDLQNKTPLAKIELKYVKAEQDQFTITPDGIIRHRGWNNQRKLNSEQVEQILQIAFPKTEEAVGNRQ